MPSFCHQFSPRSLTILLDFFIIHFFQGIVFSLIGPFYPREARKKGASATEYSMVFGIYELVIFLVSGLIGKYLSTMGARRTLVSGITLTGERLTTTLLRLIMSLVVHVRHHVYPLWTTSPDRRSNRLHILEHGGFGFSMSVPVSSGLPGFIVDSSIDRSHGRCGLLHLVHSHSHDRVWSNRV